MCSLDETPDQINHGSSAITDKETIQPMQGRCANHGTQAATPKRQTRLQRRGCDRWLFSSHSFRLPPRHVDAPQTIHNDLLSCLKKTTATPGEAGVRAAKAATIATGTEIGIETATETATIKVAAKVVAGVHVVVNPRKYL